MLFNEDRSDWLDSNLDILLDVFDYLIGRTTIDLDRRLDNHGRAIAVRRTQRTTITITVNTRIRKRIAVTGIEITETSIDTLIAKRDDIILAVDRADRFYEALVIIVNDNILKRIEQTDADIILQEIIIKNMRERNVAEHDAIRERSDIAIMQRHILDIRNNYAIIRLALVAPDDRAITVYGDIAMDDEDTVRRVESVATEDYRMIYAIHIHRAITFRDAQRAEQQQQKNIPHLTTRSKKTTTDGR